MNPSMTDLKILVTGCGGDIGLAVGRILRQLGIAKQIWGTDTHNAHAGRAIFDDCQVIAPASKPEYLSDLEKTVKRLKPDLIIPVAEPEIRRLREERIEREFSGARLITANSKTLDVGFDKLATANLLESLGLPFPWTIPVESGVPKNLPCIAKARTGSGSRTIAVIKTVEEQRQYVVREVGNSIWQEYLTPDDQEITCGVFRMPGCSTRNIQFRRKLLGGLTSSGEVIVDPEIDFVVEKLASALELRGSMNVQLRRTNRGPVIFEINPRFSSTVMFRHKLGFKDVLWSIEDSLELSPSKYSAGLPGMRFYRGSAEMFFDENHRPIELSST